ncbi:hypothetical protein [Thiorhodococcus minor]|uniref:Uncharacterized protein n=1 Tax=Thiorhodococcus minor TaxID=57489 RepID=A0A6M0JWH0_9GAMM|nr:hypothetical protein [Thiorhodococcus minor]NEV60953.1 hypothetical protein [Thiorhodococcus minor]
MKSVFHLAALGTAAALALSGCGSTGSYESGSTAAPPSGSAMSGQSDTWYTRLVGAADDGAENQLRIKGFRQVDSFESGRDGYGSVWYSDATGQCLQVIAVSGRVDSSQDIQTHPRCRR